ncbi:hypothetical protein FSP39_005923 [Pinctada imbricata]|uniref:Uncharacterized protein n=1 Tax=Pinctada imbricata TaxID=66713 RepID=A0AA88Y3C9_PINIB|nr:hypothetical protein FSP39_005923 [Pinctada imbricata]
MRREFIERYTSKAKVKPAILRDVYRYLTQDSAAAESGHQAEVDNRVAEFLLQADDTGLFYDLRRYNGRPKNEALDPFWEEAQKYFDEAAVVDDRRQGQQMYMPLAISMRSLIETIAARLPLGSACPSVSWLRLNFWPSNPYTKAAMCYTGKFNVRYAVQQRLIRQKHPDADFTFKQFQMMKEMAVKLRDKANFMCLDDKSIVPIGEPGCPVSSGVRSQNRALVPNSVKLAALDHDFHIHGAVPSVLFHVDIPENPSDSFYHGTVHVTVKDKVFNPSSALRHAVESSSILRFAGSSDGVDLDLPILFTYTDGGPDHRTTYWSVQLSYIILFVALNLDLLVAARTAPCQSYNNPAERTMSLLNLGLQNVSFQRNRMEEDAEYRVKSLTTLKKLRTTADKQPALKTALIESLEPPIAQMKQRFAQLKLHEEPVQVHDAATKDQIEDFYNVASIFLDDDCSKDDLVEKKEALKIPKLKDFIQKHCRERQYTFQVKKCQEDDCWYCTLNPPKLQADEVHWLPDPTLDENREEFLPFATLFGKETTDKDRPSSGGDSSEEDKKNRSILVAGKVRSVIICGECGKRRVVYAKQRLSAEQCICLDRVQEELAYTCGSHLLPETHRFKDTLIVRLGLNCSSSIETTYYSNVTQSFTSICFYCGDSDIHESEDIRRLKEEYSIVRPICFSCVQLGKSPAVRNALKMKRKRND